MEPEQESAQMSSKLASADTLRLTELHKVDSFYTPLEERFERISRLGTSAMGVPVAGVTLISNNKQWFKSVVGWRVSELPLKDSLCLSVLDSGEPIIVPDTHKDVRFAKSRLVTAGPKFRFYAGYPMKDSDGKIIGTFCALDVKPKKVNKNLTTTLSDLGQLAEREMITADLWDAQSQLVAKLGAARRQALLDTLTRVWNRNGGMEVLDLLLEQSKNSFEKFAVCMVDIDLFKNINDGHGHVTGDQVLRKIAASMVASVRPEDIVSRFGGDEFLVILRDAGTKICRLVADRIRGNIQAAPIRTREGDVNVTISMGIAINDPKEGATAEQLIERADQALYHTKNKGRDGVTLWPDDIR